MNTLKSVITTQLVADSMFHKLGRFLRLLGFDTELADVSWPDTDIMKKALAENKTLITRDRPFYERMQKQLEELQRDLKKVLYIPSDSLVEELAAVFFHLQIDPSSVLWDNAKELPFDTRCTVCNSQLLRVPKDSILEKISPGTAQNYDDFWECSNSSCAKIYWIGRHFNDIKEQLTQALELTRSK